jgi:hypothetical protein
MLAMKAVKTVRGQSPYRARPANISKSFFQKESDGFSSNGVSVVLEGRAFLGLVNNTNEENTYEIQNCTNRAYDYFRDLGTDPTAISARSMPSALNCIP